MWFTFRQPDAGLPDQLLVPNGVDRGGAVPVSPVPIRARRPVVAVHHRELDSVAVVAVVTAADVAVAVLRHREAIQTSRLSRRQQPDHRS